ncbi:hypothetical protein B0H14DRAFT_3428056 [Mycena olivaceomarginata]|nr:hypothetical protein B0H14DRAFT_3428056 [Mycena olivaceomarginata]
MTTHQLIQLVTCDKSMSADECWQDEHFGVCRLNDAEYIIFDHETNEDVILEAKYLQCSEFKLGARMMDNIEEYRNNCLKSKNRVVKPFAIVLSDTSAAPERGGAKKDAQPAAPLEVSEQQEHKLMAEIEKHHACQEHVGKACYVTGSGEHYQYTNNDLVIWATLMRRNLASIDKAPDQLKIEDQIDRQCRAKRGLQASQSANNFAFNGGGMWPPMAPPPWMYMAPPPWMMQPPANQATPVPAKPVTPSPPRKRKLYPAIGDCDCQPNKDKAAGSIKGGAGSQYCV